MMCYKRSVVEICFPYEDSTSIMDDISVYTGHICIIFHIAVYRSVSHLLYQA